MGKEGRLRTLLYCGGPLGPSCSASLGEMRLMVIRRLLASLRPLRISSDSIADSFEFGVHTRLVVVYE